MFTIFRNGMSIEILIDSNKLNLRYNYVSLNKTCLPKDDSQTYV